MSKPLRRTRRAVQMAGAIIVALGLSLGAASAANAETPPNSQPGQEVVEWDPGATPVWTSGASGTTPWVADRYTFDAYDGAGAYLYHTNDGRPPTYDDNANFARNLNFPGGCYGSDNSTQVVCFD